MLVKRLRGRGTNGVVEIHGEVLFAPGAVLDRWKRRFSLAVRGATIGAAPSNERPRWAHYGTPLKGTIRATTDTDIVKGGGRFHIAVGSTAHYAYFVDQGTGMHVGNAEWEAALLPPRTYGGGDFYEKDAWGRKSTVMISGQRPQNFFDAGLTRGFQIMRLRSVEIPGEGVSSLTSGLAAFPSGLADEFSGGTPNDLAFRAQREQWRQWRAEAWERKRLTKREAKTPRKPKPLSPEQLARQRAAALEKAAKERRRRENERVKALEERRREGERRRKEKEARDREERKEREAAKALRKGNAEMQREALAFYQKIREVYPDATIRSYTMDDGVKVFQVSYVTGGETVRQRWAYGYSTG